MKKHAGRRVASEGQLKQANSKNCGRPSGNNFDLEVGQGHGMVPIERTCHKDHGCGSVIEYSRNLIWPRSIFFILSV